MQINKLVIFINFLIISCKLVEAQRPKTVSDLRFFGRVGIEKEINKRWDVAFESIFKLDNDISRLDQVNLDIQTDFKILTILTVGVGYRKILRYRADDFETRDRVLGQIEVRHRIERFRLRYRVRYQNIDDDVFRYIPRSKDKHVVRNRIRASYNIRKSKFTPYFCSELYHEFDSDGLSTYKIRIDAGTNFALGELGQLRGYYRIDRELNHNAPYTYYTLGVKYVFKF